MKSRERLEYINDMIIFALQEGYSGSTFGE